MRTSLANILFVKLIAVKSVRAIDMEVDQVMNDE